MPRNDRRSRPATCFVPLEQVVISARRSRGVCPHTVERYRQLLEQGHDAPPVRLARHGDRYLVRDGRHRVSAARAAGFTVIEAEMS